MFKSSVCIFGSCWPWVNIGGAGLGGVADCCVVDGGVGLEKFLFCLEASNGVILMGGIRT